MFETATDDVFLTKEDILQKISQEDIFKIVFGELPDLESKYISPFRDDDNPGCYFEYYQDTLYFIDFAGYTTESGINLKFMTCFSAIMAYYNVSYSQALLLIKEYVENNNIVLTTYIQNSNNNKIKKLKQTQTNILFLPRNWEERDIKYWNQFNISIESLQKDFVYPISEVFIINQKKNNSSGFKVSPFAYVYTDFEKNRVQIYQPFATHYKQKKFLMSCNKNCIFGLKHIDYNCNYCFITKSYKDWKVLQNCSINSCGFINEGMMPELEIIKKVFKNFNNLIVFFDNDKAGKEAAKNVKEILIKIFPDKKIDTIFLKDLKTKDPSDFVKKYGNNELKTKLNGYIKRKYYNSNSCG